MLYSLLLFHELCKGQHQGRGIIVCVDAGQPLLTLTSRLNNTDISYCSGQCVKVHVAAEATVAQWIQM